MKSYSNNAALPTGRDGKPLPVNVSVKGNSKSSIFAIEAASSFQDYTHDYLEALLNVYLEKKKSARNMIGQNTLTSISTQVELMGRDLKDEQDRLSAFQRTNNLAILEEEGRTSGGYLTRLRTQLSDLQLESRLLMATASNPTAPLPAETNASLAVVPPPTGPGYSLSAGAPPENQTAFRSWSCLSCSAPNSAVSATEAPQNCQVGCRHRARRKTHRHFSAPEPGPAGCFTISDPDENRQRAGLHKRLEIEGSLVKRPFGRWRAAQTRRIARSRRL
jgi:hypothetical protein